MQTSVESPEESTRNFAAARQAISRLVDSLGLSKDPVLFAASNDFFSDPARQSALHLLTEGSVSFMKDDEVLFTLEPGDVIGIEQYAGIPFGRYAHEFAVRCISIPHDVLLEKVRERRERLEHWTEFLAATAGGFAACCMELLRADKNFSPVFKNYRDGEIIVEEGTSGDDVYSLVSGHADVVFQNVKVGEVKTDEIFGALAALTGIPRTASVIATKESLVLSLKKDQFLELMKYRPSTVFKMVQTMARAVCDLNARVVALSPKEAGPRIWA